MSEIDCNKKSFADLIRDYNIAIPLIQREYAQGRDNEQGQEVRKNFVPNLIEVLTGDEKSLELDFVFGVKKSTEANNKIFIPLDGQQRLTTLLLLHWYFGVHNKNWSFTYESRRIANSFVNGLLNDSSYNREAHPSKWIKNQKWFFENWLTDPTVSGMLTMLDAIHDKVTKSCDCAKLDNIIFYLYPIDQLDADNAYTKMNARGEPLTVWENLKALLDKKEQDLCLVDKLLSCNHPNCCLTDKTVSCKQPNCCLFQWIENIDGNWLFTLEQYAELNCQNYESILKDLNNLKAMGDNEQNKKAFEEKEKFFEETLDGDVKKINCAFRNIFDLAVCIDLAKQINELPSNEDKNKDNKKISSIQNQISSFHEHKTLLSDYAELINLRTFEIARDLFQTLQALNDSVLKEYWDYLCCWSPKEKKSLTEVFLFNEDYSYTDCIRFYAICRRGAESTEAWLRIIRNIIENSPNIGKDNFADAVALIDELAPNSGNIINHLAHKKIESRFASEQLKEECEKAKQIIASQNNQSVGPQKEDIFEAEQFAFFNGAIRFLYTEANGGVNWTQFCKKFDNAKKYFDGEGVTSNYRENAILLRAFLSRVEDVNFWFGNGKDFWRRMLLSRQYAEIMAELLNGECTISPQNTKTWIKDEKLITDAIKGDGDKNGQWCIQRDWNGCTETLTRYAKRVTGNINYPQVIIPLTTWRYDIVSGMMHQELLNDFRRGNNYFIGWSTEFEIQGKKIKLFEAGKKIFVDEQEVCKDEFTNMFTKINNQI